MSAMRNGPLGEPSLAVLQAKAAYRAKLEAVARAQQESVALPEVAAAELGTVPRNPYSCTAPPLFRPSGSASLAQMLAASEVEMHRPGRAR